MKPGARSCGCIPNMREPHRVGALATSAYQIVISQFTNPAAHMTIKEVQRIQMRLADGRVPFVTTLVELNMFLENICQNSFSSLCNLYYKERRQLKFFSPNSGPPYPSRWTHPSYVFLRWVGWKDYKVQKKRNWRAFLPKT
jgi:hypothetical protein